MTYTKKKYFSTKFKYFTSPFSLCKMTKISIISSLRLSPNRVLGTLLLWFLEPCLHDFLLLGHVLGGELGNSSPKCQI